MIITKKKKVAYNSTHRVVSDKVETAWHYNGYSERRGSRYTLHNTKVAKYSSSTNKVYTAGIDLPDA